MSILDNIGRSSQKLFLRGTTEPALTVGQHLSLHNRGITGMDCRHIRFSTNKSEVDFAQLQDLFKATAFWARERNIEDLEIAIANSNPIVTVWDNLCLIGFARATSDGIYRAGIWDVVIHPEYQGMGLGRKLVETVLSHPHVSKVERVYLTTTYQQSFYERIGFVRNDTTTMVLHNSQPATDLSLLEQRASVTVES